MIDRMFIISQLFLVSISIVGIGLAGVLYLHIEGYL